MKKRADTEKRFPVRNAAGNKQCRECGKERPPGVTWISWCSHTCVETYKIRAWPAHARKAAAKRDNGVCAKCGCNTIHLFNRLNEIPHLRNGVKPWVYGRADRFATASFSRVLGRHRARAFVILGRLWGIVLASRESLYDVDHIVPVAEGGGGCGLDNLRTLCLRCHRIETTALAGRLARRPTKGIGRFE